jgi:hypothetical protein
MQNSKIWKVKEHLLLRGHKMHSRPFRLRATQSFDSKAYVERVFFLRFYDLRRVTSTRIICEEAEAQ